MKVQNMTSNKGNKIANQFIIEGNNQRVLQSYNSVIARINYIKSIRPQIELDSNYWDYSVTTSKYRNIFLNESKKETQAKIDSGEYILTDLNG